LLFVEARVYRRSGFCGRVDTIWIHSNHTAAIGAIWYALARCDCPLYSAYVMMGENVGAGTQMGATNRNIILIGFMATGKTTVGSALRDRLGWNFADVDQEIVKREGKSIPEIFSQEGEPYFREIETQVLADLLGTDKQIVSTGGGAVLKETNRDLMKAGGFVVALTAPAEVLIERLSGDTNRPLVAGNAEERVHRLLKERMNAYDFAHITIDTSVYNVKETVELIVEQAGKRLLK